MRVIMQNDYPLEILDSDDENVIAAHVKRREVELNTAVPSSGLRRKIYVRAYSVPVVQVVTTGTRQGGYIRFAIGRRSSDMKLSGFRSGPHTLIEMCLEEGGEEGDVIAELTGKSEKILYEWEPGMGWQPFQIRS